MTGDKKAVIIGAGIGGITTALFLAKNGWQVDIYEKNSSAGGRCGQIIRDFRKDQLNNLTYFADDLIASNNLTRNNLREFAGGKPVCEGFRNLIGHYYALAEEYRQKTIDVLEIIKPLHEPRYQLSLEIIFDLYMMVFERIDLKNGQFTTEELNPTPDETKERVYRKIVSF